MQTTLAIARWLLSLFIAVFVGVTASGARAETLDLVNTVTIASPTAPGATTGAFSYDYTFSLTQSLSVSGYFTWVDSPLFGSTIGNFAATLRSIDGLAVLASAGQDADIDGIKTGSLFAGPLAAGNYLIRISGDATSLDGIFSGTLRAEVPAALTVAPVPEPGAWMMLTAGLALIGATTLRRRGAGSRS